MRSTGHLGSPGRPPRRRGRALAALVLAGVAGAGGIGLATGAFADAPAAPSGAASPATTGAADADGSAGTAPLPVPSTAYPGDPAREAELVAAQDRRLAKIRTVAILTGRDGGVPAQPYRIATDGATTLVLPARRVPYTLAEIAATDPQIVAQAGRVFDVRASILVRPGAVLDLSAPGATLRLASGPARFVTILNDGGRLRIAGAPGTPLHVTSWDADARAADGATADGRAYVRSIGGTAEVADAEFTDLGFWSGPTGGLSVVGRDRPSAAAIADMTRALAAPRKRVVAATRPGSPGTGSPELRVPDIDLHDPRYLLATGSVRRTSFTRDAFGLYVSDARRVLLDGVRTQDSLTHGIVLHRFVADSTVRGSVSVGNRGDGVVVDRGAAGNTVTGTESSRNGGDGFRLDGRPLASGPDAAGAGVGAQAGNRVTGGRAVDNGGVGVEVVGGDRVSVTGTEVQGGQAGIVLAEGAGHALVADDTVSRTAGHGIAVREGVSGATLERNHVSGGASGLHVRGAQAVLRGNTISDPRDHGITLVGAVAGTQVTDNVVTGHGPSAIDTMRATGLDAHHLTNDTTGWADETPWQVRARRFASPLTLVWLALGSLVVVTALRGRRRRIPSHPYADKRPLTDMTRIVDRSHLGARP